MVGSLLFCNHELFRRWRKRNQESDAKDHQKNPRETTAMKGIPVTFNGQTKTLTAWAKDLEVRPSVLFNRLRQGWSIEKTLTTPKVPRTQSRPRRASTFFSPHSMISSAVLIAEEQKRLKGDLSDLPTGRKR